MCIHSSSIAIENVQRYDPAMEQLKDNIGPTSLEFEITNAQNASLNLEEMLKQGKMLLESLQQTADGVEKKADQWINRSIILLGGMVGLWAKLVSEKQALLSSYALVIIVAIASSIFLFYRSSAPSLVAMLGFEPKKWERNDNINQPRNNIITRISASYQAAITINETRLNRKSKLFGYGLRVLLGVSIAIIPLMALWSLRFVKA